MEGSDDRNAEIKGRIEQLKTINPSEVNIPEEIQKFIKWSFIEYILE